MSSGARDWSRLKEILADALELPLDERPAFIEGICGDDTELRARIDDLLGASTTAPGVLDAPPVLSFVEEQPRGRPSLEGEKVGAYRVVRRLGRGGMGTVYEAVQESPRRAVALKVMRDGLASRELETRFRYEAEILGHLKHPAVAQVFEASVWRSPDGVDVPYFVMELVEGDVLTRAAAGAGLDQRQLLELMIKICAGVQHAHQNGVIHRDLKPDNILVTRDGQPKILDFGIARLTAENARTATLQTAVGQVLGTLEYMSPEQVRGDPAAIDTRCDVYALGAILQVLLTGKLPLDLTGKSLPEAIRAILEEEPTPPSRYATSCRGDLDTIVATALDKEKDRRYPSASALADDLQRTLDDETISARPASAAYQLTKFARRHRGLVGGLAAAFIILLLGVVGTAYGFLRATRARDAAVAAKNEAQAGNAFLRSMLAAADPNEMGRDVTVLEILDKAVLEVDSAFPEQPRTRALLHSTLGWSYYSLGNLEAAESELERAVDLHRETLGAAHERTIEEENRRVQVLLDRGKLAAARAHLESAEERAAPLGAEHAVALGLLSSRASLLGSTGELEASEEAYVRLLELQKRKYGADDDSVLGTLNNLGGILRLLGKLDAAEQVFRDVYETRLERFGATHSNTLLAGINLGLAIDSQGRSGEAEALYRKLLTGAVKVWGPEHPRTLTLKNNLASCLTSEGKLEEAVELSEETLAAYRELYGPDDDSATTTLNNLAVALAYLRRFEEAARYARELLRILEPKLGLEHHETLTVMANLAGILDDLDRFDEARALCEKALGLREKTLGEAHPDTLISRNNFARMLQRRGKNEEALPILRRNLELAEKGQPGHPNNTLYFGYNLAICLRDLQRSDEAEPLLLKARDLAREQWDEDHAHRRKIERKTAELLGEAAAAPRE